MATDGINILKTKLATLPSGAGVYRMLNADNAVLYVGKAKNLKKRVTSYTQPERMGARIRKMVFETKQLVVVETGTEAEALLLEANLIKSLKPKYNILFRDDATYISLLITGDKFPQIKSYRGKKPKNGTLFGPYPSAKSVHQTLDLMERAFRLRTCANSVFNNRTRPCLKYEIKRCSAPCVSKISQTAYAKNIAEATSFLQGKGKKVQVQIKAKMDTAAAKMDYEKAAQERDRLRALANITGNSNSLSYAVPYGDIFAIVTTQTQACVQVFHYRNGMHVGNTQHFIKGIKDTQPPEILKQFLAQYYEKRPTPPIILLNILPAEHKILAEALTVAAAKKINISLPSRGIKKQVIQQAEMNAKQALSRQMDKSANWKSQMAEFGKLLKLKTPPKHIDCYDISNISGKQAVASLVVAGQEGMEKKKYRKFKIKTKDTPDDYAMMAEVLTRRYSKIFTTKNSPEKPDIIMVDGGKGHLNTLVKVTAELKILNQKNCPTLISIAKGEERDKGLEKIYQYKNGKIKQLNVEFGTPLIFMLQQIRDEAHRFAISFHRQQRSKGLKKSALDSIPNIGAKRKKALLLAFGSAAGVKSASVKELSQIDGISPKTATKIHDWLQA